MLDGLRRVPGTVALHLANYPNMPWGPLQLYLPKLYIERADEACLRIYTWSFPESCHLCHPSAMQKIADHDCAV